MKKAINFSTNFIIIFSCLIILLNNIRLNKKRDLVVKNMNERYDLLQKKYDSLHCEFTIISNKHDRFIYSIEHIKGNYPTIVEEFYNFYENETE